MFAWNPVVGADHYYLYVFDNDAGGPIINNPNVNSTTFTPSSSQALTPGHHFTWYFGAYSACGTAIGSISIQNFILAPLPAPTLISPTGTIVANNGYDMPMFSWIALTGADHYYLYVTDLNTGGAVVNEPNVGNGASYQLKTTEPLATGHSFLWLLGAVSTNGAVNNYNAAAGVGAATAARRPWQIGKPATSLILVTKAQANKWRVRDFLDMHGN